MAGAQKLLLPAAVVLVAYYFFMPDSFSPEKVRGKRVLVTGSSTGIGEQIAYHFARMGAHVILTARREQQLQMVKQRCLELGAASADYVLSDMSDLSSAGNVIKETQEKLGGLDYLVLNHFGGIGKFGYFKGEIQHVVSSLTVNFLSYVQLSSAAMSMLKESQGSIIAISSLSGRIGAPFTVVYCASKFAVEGFYSSLRRELILQQVNVSVTVAILGYIDTDNAIKTVGNKIKIAASPKEECALEVVKAGVLRMPEVFYPFWSIKIANLLRDIAPELMANIFDQVYILENIS
ncbi:hydroxysteroid 11-beta-dehydrogenase 1-like protein B [Heptranchias perlo]|uniref:hydroxysteroid 11-beta-dehydrogenase 1-like protein B n=1 Tax=Heptranchias perlo TaxID=212740 RepID=UPI00355A82C2